MTLTRVLDLNHVIRVSRVQGVPVLYVTAVFNCLQARTQTVVDIEVDLVVYENQPLSAVDSAKYKFSGRAKRALTSLVKKYLEGWDGVEFDRKLESEVNG